MAIISIQGNPQHSLVIIAHCYTYINMCVVAVIYTAEKIVSVEVLGMCPELQMVIFKLEWPQG
jgi:hypothetical protein